MAIIEQSFLDFNFNQEVNQNSDLNFMAEMRKNPFATSLPSFEEDFLPIYKKTYSSEA